MAKIKNDYFKLAEQQAACCVEAADLLEEIFADYNPEKIVTQKNKMHEIENRADEIHHDINTRLSVEFITPIDQEDILHLVQIIDDVTDSIDDVVLRLYMYNVDTLPSDAHALSSLVNRCVKALYEAVKEVKSFKKPEGLRKLLVEVNAIEGEADAAYAEAIHKLFRDSSDVKKLIGDKAVYERLEACSDLCEHAADVIEQIIIKNT